MKKRSLILLFLSFSLAFTACESYLDINTDPNYPTTSSNELLLPSAIAGTASRLGSSLQLIGSFWCQHYTQNNSSNQYNTDVTYDIKTSSYNAVWSAAYAGALKDLQTIIVVSEKSKQWNYYLPAKVLTAFNYHFLVDFYETIPFTDVLQGDKNLAPKYSDSKTVYAGIIKILDDAIAKKDLAMASEDAFPIGARDFVYKGDIKKWVSFAKSLKFKILMRDFDNNKAALAALITDNDFVTTDARMNGFVDQLNNSNPLYEDDRRALNTTGNLRASNTLMSFLIKNNDPRIGNFFETAKGIYKGLPYGNTGLTTSAYPANTASRARLDATDPVYFLSVAESYFTLAEYYARSNDAVNAKKYYNMGVTEAFLRWRGETPASDYIILANSFTGVGGAYEFTSDPTKMVEQIITQKWVASVRCQAWDSFLDINRTGYPQLGTKQTTAVGYISGQLVPAASSVLQPGELPRRLLVPKSSSDYNPNAPKVIPLATKMWWHK